MAEKIITAGKKFFDDINGRNNHERVIETCGKVTNTFLRGVEFMGPGSYNGACGTRKDNQRIYICSDCARAHGYI